MGRLDLIKPRHVNYLFAAAGMLCLFGAALQLRDPEFIILALGVSAFAYFIGKEWQAGDETVARRHPVLVYWTSCALLLACLLILLLGPAVIEPFRWLFLGMAVFVGSRLKAA
jgi:hypothetical protein